MEQDNESQIQVKLVTQQRKYAVSDSAILVPANLRRYGLSEIVNHLLGYEKPIPFDFLIDGEFLRTSLSEYLQNAGLSTENIVTLEYVESMLPPSSLSAYQHDDWVSSVRGHEQGYFLTGSYDNNARIWNPSGECLQTFVGHDAPIKSVAWVSIQEEDVICLTASQDRTIRAWHSSISDKQYDVLYECRGHKGSVESISINAQEALFSSGSWDSSIRIWTTTATPNDEDGSDYEFIENAEKRRKIRKKKATSIIVKKPISILTGHVGPVSSVFFDTKDPAKLYSGGWDYSIRTWDIESRTNVDTKNCDQVVYDIAYSEKSGLIASGHADRAVRLWDSRAEDVAVVKLSLVSHQNWVSAVSWSESSPFMLTSASYDSCVKIWDIRSKTPLYTLRASDSNSNNHNRKKESGKKLLCIDWSKDLILSGGEDNRLHIHGAKKIEGPYTKENL
ncbi:13062_t:CDS:10 [Ambispora leptoticha]|uniref:Ribosome biogenesis protein YTM1 n=1 Tax=Ambispora leptoticha TaxID=144679 RepID=A0A9N8V522_9GLOM|nr:13062_t:CDS:10 [Ambispora leptoticha]